MHSKVVVALVVAGMVLFAVAASTAQAAPGGKGKGKGGGRTGDPAITCALTVTPNPVTFGSSITVKGSGFQALQQVTIDRDGVGYGMFADANGQVTVQMSSGAVGGHTVLGLALMNTTWTPCGSTTYTTV